MVDKGAASSIGRKRESESVSDSAGVKNDSLASISSQAGSPSLVMAAEFMICGAGRPGGLEGTSISPLHLGQGRLWPSICSWRTITLLEQ